MIRDKLKTLTGPCREVDAEIAETFGVQVTVMPLSGPHDANGLPVPHFTASLDATVELVERELPKVIEPEWSLETASGGYWACFGHERCTQSGALHKLPAVALLLALLDAKGIE